MWGVNCSNRQRDRKGKPLSLDNLLVKQIGNGEETKSWNDTWCDTIPLAKRFPRLAAGYTQGLYSGEQSTKDRYRDHDAVELEEADQRWTGAQGGHRNHEDLP